MTACPRCGGQIVNDHPEPVCLQCGYVVYRPDDLRAAHDDVARYGMDGKREPRFPGQRRTPEEGAR